MQVQHAARADRRIWLDEAVANGDWACIRRLRKGVKLWHCGIRDLAGTLKSSDHRAETLAEHLGQIPWKVTFVEAGLPLGLSKSTLPVRLGNILVEEVKSVVKKASARTCSWLR